ncbi:hypothetical protein JQX08_22020 [Pseudomonas sp. UL073]|uniref:Uncharacterized protein n=1 Tax=Zestomonas insulae TaxID=2809017 RepID=A0ABS2IK22_9GAMM|nr:hypothetical protein [Pseudomonas insulae]MBM7063406.1 hypothetical protein [Pseudomonas insulae]
MDKLAKIERWAFPFKAKGASPGALPQAVSDPLLYYRALAGAHGGAYPLADNGLWHGGVHFDDGTAGLLEQSSVHCIADGEVIAYRIDERYPTSQYETGTATYSTGFVLVRHRLEMPVPQDKLCTRIPELTFYSLYMHLQDWAGYQQPGAAAPAAFLGPVHYRIQPDKARDAFRGLFVRAAAPGHVEHSRKIALLPKGCTVRVGETAPGNANWRRLLQVIDGQLFPAQASCSGWVFIGELERSAEADVYLVGARANDHDPTLLPGQGLNVRQSAKSVAPVTGVLPAEATLTLAPGMGDYRQLERIVSGQEHTPLTPGSANHLRGYVHFASLRPQLTTPTLNRVHVLAKPQPIKAGELVGHLGHYRNHNQGRAAPLLHLETFSCDDVPAFINQCRQLAALLPDSQKTLLKIHKGASQLIPHREGTTPDICMRGATIGVDLTLPISYLDSLPATHKQQVSYNVPGSREPRVVRWWRLDNLLVDQAGQPINGWLAEQELITTRHSPWEWEGFDCLEETCQPIDHLALQLDACGQLSAAERSTYRAQIERASLSPIYQRLRQIIDSNRDKQLAPAEIRTSLEKPWSAQAISRLIVRYESEWGWSPERWEALEPIMSGAPGQSNVQWAEEKKRIKHLSWWAEAGLPGGPTNHFHPLALLNTFNAQRGKSGWARSKFADLLGKVESKNDYSAYNRTTPAPLRSFYKTNLTSLTISQVQEKQAAREMFAIGRYQLIPDTLAAAIKHLNLDTSIKFDEATQDKIFEEYLIKIKRKALINFLEGEGSVEDAIYAWAMEFASAGVRKGRSISPTLKRDKDGKIAREGGKKIFLPRTASYEGQSYYAGDGLNSAHILPDEMVCALNESKRNGK